MNRFRVFRECAPMSERQTWLFRLRCSVFRYRFTEPNPRFIREGIKFTGFDGRDTERLLLSIGMRLRVACRRLSCPFAHTLWYHDWRIATTFLSIP